MIPRHVTPRPHPLYRQRQDRLRGGWRPACRRGRAVTDRHLMRRRTVLQRALRCIVADILAVPTTWAWHDDFFALGGDLVLGDPGRRWYPAVADSPSLMVADWLCRFRQDHCRAIQLLTGRGSQRRPTRTGRRGTLEIANNMICRCVMVRRRSDRATSQPSNRG